MNPAKNKKPLNTLDEVVKKLQWAAVGKSEAPSTTDDIDSYVSNLLIEEAKKSNKLYDKLGPRAYLDPSTGSEPCQLRKTNKVFLNNIMKSTNSHNRNVAKSLACISGPSLEKSAHKKARTRKDTEHKPRQSVEKNVSKSPSSYHKVEYKYKDLSRESLSRKRT